MFGESFFFFSCGGNMLHGCFGEFCIRTGPGIVMCGRSQEIMRNVPLPCFGANQQ